MKAKRIVSILLTGSMLLSLLPVSALAAAPVFDAPAQTTAKKAAPLVQEADASRSTEEEAATRSSRDLDAENGTADSITIQLNAEGKPESEGDSEHWAYDYATSFSLNLRQGTFTLQPSSEPGAESALQTDLDIYKDAEFNGGTVGKRAHNEGTISNGTFQWEVYNYGTISDGTFQGKLHNYQTISDGTFQGKMYNSGTISGGIFKLTVTAEAIFQPAQIEGGTFEDGMKIYPDAYYPTTITDGLFDGKVFTEAGSLIKPLTISGGLFTKAVDVSSITNLPNLQITGGYFVSKPTVPEGSVSFTSVSGQNGSAFQVPVNGDWSESGYNKLYVPNGSPAQPNTITVKTHTKLLYYLADGEQFPVPDSDSDSYVYKIPVQNYEKIVLVTEEPPAPPPDDPGELDPGLSSGAAALGVVLGTAGLGYITYAHISSLYLYYTLPGGFIPSTRQELANVLWTTAGKPDPVSTALYTDIPADAIEQQKAARWCVEQGLLSDYGATFGPDTKVTNARIIRAWNSLKKVPVPITN
ncbi:MAG: hypothetical protein UC907_01760 [Faecalibacterium prausnitzii]|jgi:hypothetical protein